MPDPYSHCVHRAAAIAVDGAKIQYGTSNRPHATIVGVRKPGISRPTMTAIGPYRWSQPSTVAPHPSCG